MKKVLLILILGMYLGSCCGNSSGSDEDKSVNIGKTVTIDGQIYTIIDHNSTYEEYTLSNDMVISDKYPTNY